jgi:hypothetical protein
MVVIAALGTAALAVTLVTSAQRHPTCPSATNLLGKVASPQQEPRLCELGAPSRLIGSGRLNGVSWRIVVTPPRPWSAYYAAGFTFPVSMPGRGGNCIVEADSSSSVSYNCGSWEPAGLAGQFLTTGCSDGTIVICYAGLEKRADHFVVVQAYGSELTVRSVPFLGVSFTAFAMPKGERVGVMTAYDARGRSVASTTSF